MLGHSPQPPRRKMPAHFLIAARLPFLHPQLAENLPADPVIAAGELCIDLFGLPERDAAAVELLNRGGRRKAKGLLKTSPRPFRVGTFPQRKRPGLKNRDGKHDNGRRTSPGHMRDQAGRPHGSALSKNGGVRLVLDEDVNQPRGPRGSQRKDTAPKTPTPRRRSRRISQKT